MYETPPSSEAPQEVPQEESGNRPTETGFQIAHSEEMPITPGEALDVHASPTPYVEPAEKPKRVAPELGRGDDRMWLRLVTGIEMNKYEPYGYQTARRMFDEADPDDIRPIHHAWLATEAQLAGRTEELTAASPDTAAIAEQLREDWFSDPERSFMVQQVVAELSELPDRTVTVESSTELDAAGEQPAIEAGQATVEPPSPGNPDGLPE